MHGQTRRGIRRLDGSRRNERDRAVASRSHLTANQLFQLVDLDKWAYEPMTSIDQIGCVGHHVVCVS